MKNLDKLLEKVSLEELRLFVINYSLRHPEFISELEVYFADQKHKTDLTKTYKEHIRNIIKRYERKGFIEYKDSFKLSGDFSDLLQSGELLLSNRNFQDAYTLSKIALQESIQVITYCDDSAGCIGDVIYSFIALLAEIAAHTDTGMSLKQQLFSWLEAELEQSIYFDYGDFGYRMFEIFESMAMKTGQANPFLTHLDRQMAKPADGYSNFRQNFYIIRKIKFLYAIDRVTEADVLISVHPEIVEVRQMMVDRAIADHHFSHAKRLVNEGMEIAYDKDHPGTVSKWQKELLRIAVLEGDQDSIRHYNKHFAFDRGFNKAYYLAWKATYHAEEWTIVLEQCIREQIALVLLIYEKNKQHAWLRDGINLLSLHSTVAQIYIEEGLLDRLLELVLKERSLGMILSYHDVLVGNYPKVLLSKYLQAIREHAEEISDRKQYKELVKHVRRIIKDIPDGKQQLLELVQELANMYSRRPAMVDELNKLMISLNLN